MTSRAHKSFHYSVFDMRWPCIPDGVDGERDDDPVVQHGLYQHPTGIGFGDLRAEGPSAAEDPHPAPVDKYLKPESK